MSDFSPEDRCAVYDAAIAYAENGTLPSLNPVLQMAFKFIKKDIDEMQGKYESTCQKRREAANKRWQKMQKHTNDTNGCKSIQEEQKHNLHYEHEHEHEHEKNKDKSLSSTENIINAQARGNAAYADGNLLVEFFAPEKTATLEALAMQLHLTFDELRQMAQEVVNEWTLTGQTHTTYNDASRHLISTLRKKKQWSKPPTNERTKEPGLGVGEYRNAKGQRTYNGDTIVPESAPPRPSAAHWWSEASNNWSKQI